MDPWDVRIDRTTPVFSTSPPTHTQTHKHVQTQCTRIMDACAQNSWNTMNPLPLLQLNPTLQTALRDSANALSVGYKLFSTTLIRLYFLKILSAKIITYCQK